MTPNFKFSRDPWYRSFVLRYNDKIESFQYYRDVENTHPFPHFPVVTHCSYCFNDIDLYKRKINSFAHQEFNRYPWTNDSFIFRMHYCRHGLLWPSAHPPDEAFVGEDLVPNDERLKFLIDPNFMLDISRTIFTEKDLPTLCNAENDWFENATEFPPVLKKKFYIGEKWDFYE